MNSLPFILTSSGNSLPTASRTAAITSSPKRTRLSKQPPYASSRRLVRGERNSLIRYPVPERISTASNPASFTRRAACAKEATISAISGSSSSFGVSRVRRDAMADGATGCFPPISMEWL